MPRLLVLESEADDCQAALASELLKPAAHIVFPPCPCHFFQIEGRASVMEQVETNDCISEGHRAQEAQIHLLLDELDLVVDRKGFGHGAAGQQGTVVQIIDRRSSRDPNIDQ